MTAAPAQLLPPLREDLRLAPGAPTPEGRPTWLIYDPLAHRYHELDAVGLAIIGGWAAGKPVGATAAAASAAHGRAIDDEEVAAVVRFAEDAGLVVEPSGGWRRFEAELERRKSTLFGWMLHNYLFVRVPLVRPQGFLVRTLPLAMRLVHPGAVAAIAAAGLVGLILVGRQWDAFFATFQQALSPEGIAGYALALVAVKLLHELGHAYTAVRYGCRVPSMGVAFMVMMPVLYTDVSDAWRLQDRSKRLRIDAAGVAVELALACVATLVWAFLPEGAGRSVAFFVATASWTLSLAVNLNPFMRFDGYYLLADLIGVSNLQPRAFALLRWRVRETLFGLRDPCPEDWSARRRFWIALYGAAVCVYRLVLFTGIAVMVYAMTFKILGIILFAVEIGWFVIRPIATEVRFWWGARERMPRGGRAIWSVGALAAVALLLALPLSTRVAVPAIAEPARSERITAVAPARIVSVDVAPGERVTAGRQIAALTSPKLEQEIAVARAKLALVTMKNSRRTVDAADRQASLVLAGEQRSLSETLNGLEMQRRDLILRAGFDGVVSELAPDLHVGRWLGRGDEIGQLVSAEAGQIRGLVPEVDLARIRAGATAVFSPDDLTVASRPLELVSISRAASATLDMPYLASTYGGPVAVREERNVGAVPVEAQYMVVLKPARTAASIGVARGVALLEADGESVLGRLFRRVVAVLVRESGF